jgi:hypothetical protein
MLLLGHRPKEIAVRYGRGCGMTPLAMPRFIARQVDKPIIRAQT